MLLRGQSTRRRHRRPAGCEAVEIAIGAARGAGLVGQVAPRYAWPDAGEDLVRVRAGPRGPLADRRLPAVARPEQHDLVAHLDRRVTGVDDELIHRDPAGDPMAASMHPDLRRGRRVA